MARQLSRSEGAGKGRLKSRIRAFWRSRKGVSFVEFAIIAAPLFLMFFGIVEVGLIFWASLELENATADAGRLVRTGQAQNMSAASLKAQICSEVFILSNCNSKVQLSIQTFPGGFSTMTLPQPLDSKGNLVTTLSGDPTQVGASQDVLLTTYYEWPLVSPLVSAVLGNMGDGNFLLQEAAAFRSEPF